MNIEQYNRLVDEINNNPTYLRTGQYAFNQLHNMDAKLAGEITGTEFDPYYDDDKIIIFLDKVLENVR